MNKELLETLIKDIEAGDETAVNSRLLDLSDDQLDELFAEVQPYKALGTASSEKFVLGSVCNLREKYMKKLLTTALVRFLFQIKDEYTVDEAMLENAPNKDDFMDAPPPTPLPEGFNKDLIYNEELSKLFKRRFPKRVDATSFQNMESDLSEDDLLVVNKRTNKRLEKLSQGDPVFNTDRYNVALVAAVEEQSAKERAVVNRFLEHLFKFNPDTHEQPGGQSCVGDPERTDVSLLEGTDQVYDTIPPNDTHSRFNSYYEINYETLREATQQIYNVKPDLEHAMIVYDVVDTQDEVDAFIRKYGSSSKSDIVSFPQNRWTLMGAFKENRKRVEFYNKHNTVIKAMLDQQEKDQALGEELLKNRVKSKKVKAEKVFGKDSPAFETYRKFNPNELETKYGTMVEEVNDDMVKVSREVVVDEATGKELKVDEDGVPFNALEAPASSFELNGYLDRLIEPIHMGVYDINKGRKTKETSVSEKAASLKQTLSGIDDRVHDKINKSDKVIVVVEYQMSANYTSNAVFNMIVYHYAGRYPVEVIKPSWKNTVALHPQLTIAFFLGCSSSNYKANKHHTLYNMLYFLIMTNRVDMIKDIKRANQDDIADTLMQAISWHLRHPNYYGGH